MAHSPGAAWCRWFEIHDLATLKSDYDDHLKYLADSGKPVYVREPTPKIPNCVVYPRETIVERFGSTYFFTRRPATGLRPLTAPMMQSF